MEWKPIETAPKDGEPIIGIYHNDCGWEYRIIYWNGIPPDEYPWAELNTDNYWAESKIDYWMPFPEPPTKEE